MPNELCPFCGRHCPLDDPHCDRGMEYAKTGGMPSGKHERESGDSCRREQRRHEHHRNHGGGHHR